MLVFYMDDDAEFWDHVGGAPAVAFPWNGTTSFNRRTMGDWWNDRDDCCIGRWSANGRDGQVIVHEVLHLLGFKHPDSASRYGVLMAWGSTMAPLGLRFASALPGTKGHRGPEVRLPAQIALIGESGLGSRREAGSAASEADLESGGPCRCGWVGRWRSALPSPPDQEGSGPFPFSQFTVSRSVARPSRGS